MTPPALRDLRLTLGLVCLAAYVLTTAALYLRPPPAARAPVALTCTCHPEAP